MTRLIPSTPQLTGRMFVNTHLRIIITYILLIASGGFTFGQQTENYSTYQSYDTAAISKTIWQAVKLQYTDLDSADRMLKQAYIASREAGFKEGMFNSMYGLGFGEQWTGGARKAIAYYKNALRYATPTNTLVAPLYNNMGCAYLSIGKNRVALDNFNKALAYAKGAKAPLDSSLSYVNIAGVWAGLEEHEQAMMQMQKATDIARRAGDSRHLCQAYLTSATLCTYNSKWEDAIAYVANAQQYSDSASYSTRISIYDIWASALIGMEKYNEALAVLQNAKTIADTCGEVVPTFYTEALTGSVYLKTNDIANARKWLLPAYEAGMTTDNQQIIQSVQREVAELYYRSNEYGNAYAVLRNYTDSYDSLNKIEKSLLLQEWIDMQAEEKNETVLKQQLAIAQREQKIRTKYLWAGASVLSFLLLLSVSIGTVRIQKNKLAMRRSEVDYLRQSGEIDELKARIRGEENERQRIATDLHNNIAGQVWAIRMKVEQVRQTGERDGITYLSGLINNAAEDIRKTAENLLAKAIEENDLAALLTELCEKANNNTPLTITFSAPHPLKLTDKHAQYHLYTMVQELVQNAIKHANSATRISVTALQEETKLTVTVEDDGQPGYKESTPGIGLGEIKKRVAGMNGAFQIVHETQGTRAQIILPNLS